MVFFIKRSLKSIEPVATSHNAGMKRVLFAANESGCRIMHFAITDLRAGDIAEAHSHEDMQEGVYVLRGESDVALNEAVEHCVAEDFVLLMCGTRNEPRAITDVRVMTIGCEIRYS